MTEKNQSHNEFIHKLDKSAVITVLGIILLFSMSVAVVLIAPALVDPTWTNPSSTYQVQMYEVSDPNLYIGSQSKGGNDLQFVYHLKDKYTLLAFQENDFSRILAKPEFEKYVTKQGEDKLKLTSRLLLLRHPEKEMVANADKARKELQDKWEKDNQGWKEKGIPRPDFDILELYAPEGSEAFALAPVDGTIENWVGNDFVILDPDPANSYHSFQGVIYVSNPKEYRIKHYKYGTEEGWQYDPKGEKIANLEQLKSLAIGFRSRAELIRTGEHIFAVEGCWYCHTDQTRTLVQDVVLNGSANFPAPPSSANEYIYQHVTFPGTRRIGPDLSRTGIKKPSRDWHKGHFWSPKTASAGSIMPSFRHFFDNDPRGNNPTGIGIPNYRFEAVYQYLMTKGTRITPPTEAWWLGKDPVDTKAIIEGRKKLK